ncbi:hypothetical protein M8J76_005515 [Diaphorina citri]|nr:hypothetical protein M8J76_005515 [Diaphorina citri]
MDVEEEGRSGVVAEKSGGNNREQGVGTPSNGSNQTEGGASSAADGSKKLKKRKADGSPEVEDLLEEVEWSKSVQAVQSLKETIQEPWTELTVQSHITIPVD